VGSSVLAVWMGTLVRSCPTLFAPSLFCGRGRPSPLRWVVSGSSRAAPVTALMRFLESGEPGRSGSGDPGRSQAGPLSDLSASAGGVGGWAVRSFCKRGCSGSGGTQEMGGRPGSSPDPGARVPAAGCGGGSLGAGWLVLPRGCPGRETLACGRRGAGWGLLVILGWLSLQGTG